MKKILFLFILFQVTKNMYAQTQPYIYTIKADSVKITNSCDTAELIIENHTQSVPGFLYNKGRGRTEFRRATKLNDSTIVLGGDTIILRGNILANDGLSQSGNMAQLGQPVGASGNPAMLLENRELPLNGNSLKFTGTAGNQLFDNSGNVSITGNASVLGGTLYSHKGGYAGSPGWHSTKSLWLYSDNNNPVFASVGNSSTSYTMMQLTTDSANVPAVFSGVILGFNYLTNPSDTTPKPLEITTSGYQNSYYKHAGDIIIRPCTTQGSYYQTHGPGDYNVILDPAGLGEVKAVKTLNAQTSVKMNSVVSAAASLTLDLTGTIWIYSGSTSTNWTLPSVTGNANLTYFIKNRGSAAISLYGTIYSSSAVSSFTINPGEAYILSNDGTYWNIF